jgi:hypothetical protein
LRLISDLWMEFVMFRSGLSPLVAALAVAAFVLAGGAARAGEDPDYPHGDFEGDCTTCHGDDGWTPPVIDPGFRKNEHPFPLKQAHSLPDCKACHRSLDFTQADAACIDCHQDPHRGELGIDCARCHVPRTFIDRTRMQREHQRTRFPLRGSHRALDCEDCHRLTPPGSLQWVNTPVECVDCHRQAYVTTSEPDHQDSGFPETCDRCHAPTIWEAARFDHSLTSAPCETCHLSDYQATDDPDHQSAGFPTGCELCHRPTRWDDASFDHDGPYFPIYSGRHRNRWDACSTCHTNPSNYSEFTCFSCHPHSDESRTRRDHEGVGGFSYDSAACYACHPTGEED